MSEIANGGPHDGEVSPVECGDVRDAEPFCIREDRSVCGAEGKVSVLGKKFSDPHPVARMDVLSKEVARCEIAEEPNLGIGAQASADEIGHLGDDKWRWR